VQHVFFTGTDDNDEDDDAVPMDCHDISYDFLSGCLQVLPNYDEPREFWYVSKHIDIDTFMFHDDADNNDDDIDGGSGHYSPGQDPETESYRCSGRVRRPRGRSGPKESGVSRAPPQPPLRTHSHSPSQGTW
jgi:hypothetical protein